MAIPYAYGKQTEEDMERAGEGLGTDLISKGLVTGYNALKNADQNLARGINEHVLGGLPILPVGPAPPSLTPPPPSNDNASTALPDAISALGGPPPSSALSDAVRVSGGLGVAMPKIGPDVKVTQMVQTPGEVTAGGRLDTATDEAKDIARRAGTHNVAQAKDLDTQIQSEQTQLAEQKKLADARKLQEQKTLDAADGYLKQQREAYAKDGVKEFYADKSTASKVFSALMVGLGQYAATISGGPNLAWGILQDSMNRHQAKERDRLAKSKDMVELAGKDQATAERRREYAELELRNQKIALLEDFKRQRETRMAKYGANSEELKTDALINQIETERAKEQVQLQQGLRKQITTDNSSSQQFKVRLGLAQAAASAGPDKNIKDADNAERKADGYLMQMTTEVKNLQGMNPYSAADQRHLDRWRQTVGSNAPTTAEKFFSNIASINGDVIKDLSTAGRRRFLAEKNYAESYLRPRTGALIGGSEYVEALDGVQRFVTDDPQTAQDKAKRVHGQVEGLAIQTYRPGYWNSVINPAREAPKLTSKQRAEAVEYLKTHPGDQEVRQRLLMSQ